MRTPTSSEPSDDALMARVQSGDTDAFAELYDRHAARAYRVALATCHDPVRAERAVQEGFRAIWRRREQFKPEDGSFKAWSTGIVSSRAIGSKATAEQVIALAYFGELSHSEIAALLDLPTDTVKVRMRLGLEELREQLGAPN